MKLLEVFLTFVFWLALGNFRSCNGQVGNFMIWYFYVLQIGIMRIYNPIIFLLLKDFSFKWQTQVAHLLVKEK